MTDQEIAVRESQPIALAPRDVISGATEQATVLMEIVQSKGLFAMVGGKRYLEAEAWEVILAFNNVSPDVVYVNPVMEDGVVVAYEAKVNLIDRAGALRGSGIAECSLESFPTRGREGRDKDKAAKSAAQTWAISKAARMAFSWVAVLAGFEPTPAAEMRGASPETDYGTCQIHDIAYFKSAKMRGPAHKLDGGGWCNAPTDVRSSPAEADSEARGTEEPTESDGASAFFPSATVTSEDSLWKALGGLGLNKKQHTVAVEKIIGGPLAEARDLQDVYNQMAHEHAERTRSAEQGQG